LRVVEPTQYCHHLLPMYDASNSHGGYPDHSAQVLSLRQLRLARKNRWNILERGDLSLVAAVLPGVP
jgi:hypothetical protein